MKAAKDEIRELPKTLPDDASLADIQYHIYVRWKVENGLAAVRERRTLTPEEVVWQMSQRIEIQCRRDLPGNNNARQPSGTKVQLEV